jgi:cytoskeletal protein RodZ
MRTIGQLLKEAREAKLYTLDEVEKHTKIRKELLRALENNDYEKLPPLTFIQGFVKNYGKFLGLESDKLLAVLRRDFEATKHPPSVMESFSKPLSKKRFLVTPSRLIGAVVAIIIVTFFAYLWFEYRQFVGSPVLEVNSPSQGQTVEVTTISVEGITDPDSKVTINDQEVGLDTEGKFKEEVKLSSSVNNISIVSTSKFGQSTKVERTVYIKSTQ